MKILVKFNKNISTPKQVKSFKVFNLGTVITTINDLLDSATIEIDDQTLPVLKVINNSFTEYYLIDNVGLTPGLSYPYYTDDFMKDITISDLILINNGQQGEQNIQSDWDQTNILLDDYIKNKPTSLSQFLNDLDFATETYVNTAISNIPTGVYLSNNPISYSPATLPLTGTEVALLNDGTNWVKITWNNIISSLSSVFQLIEKLVTTASVTGAYNIDWSNDVWDLTLTGNTTLTESNLPASGKTKTITLNISGNFTLTYPAGWTSKITGAYSGTAALNTITIQYYGSGKYKVQIVQPT